MSLNETEEQSNVPDTFELEEASYYGIHGSTLVLTLGALIYGVTSWRLIRKFRNFKNFVYLNAVLSCALRLTAFIVISLLLLILEDKWHESVIYDVAITLFHYSLSAQCCWFLVICYVFYSDIVKVFNVDIKRKYMKSCLFAWGLPTIITIIIYLISQHLVKFLYYNNIISGANSAIMDFEYFYTFVIIFPLMINLVIYLKLVYALFSHKSVGTANNKWRDFYMATLIFIFSDLVFLGTSLAGVIDWLNSLLSPLMTTLTTAALNNLGTISIALFIPLSKRNRDLWQGYNKLRRQK